MLDVTGLTARPRELTPVLGKSQASPPSRLRPLPRPTPSSTQRFGSSFIVHIPPFGAVGRPLQEPVIRRGVYLFTRKGRTLSPAAEAMLAHLREAIAQQMAQLQQRGWL